MTDVTDDSLRPDDGRVDDAFHVFDTTLRDGAQREGINLTVADKLTIARHLDDFGVGFIEGGWPGANPRDTEFFQRAAEEIDFRHARLVAFGATRKAGVRAEDDPQVAALLDSGAPVITLVAKSHDRHVELALRTTLDENLAMVRDTVAYLRERGRRVFVDCEHFFDGYRANPDYAVRVVRAAHEAGADVVVLCDTNGGMLPAQVEAVVRAVLGATGARLGIHAQDDTGCAVANTLAAVDGGATHVQCTANGYGERVGNANLFPVVAALELKCGRTVLPAGALAEMTRISHAIAEVVNLTPSTHQPYVGVSAFAHKAGLHASAIKVDPDLYQHIAPEAVGNTMRMLVSDMAGRASIELKGKELGVDLGGDRELVGRVVERVKERELAGYTYEAADASFELLLRQEVEGRARRYYRVESWRAIVEDRPDGTHANEATVKLWAKGERIVATAEGNGPVDALDRALRVALERIYPQLAELELVDYKVRILEGRLGTGSITRVLVSTSDGRNEWSTVGVAENVIAASWQALDDAYAYGLRRAGVEPQE
ncbi:transferase [Streptomyces eurocidicus]|uniref:Citramalate synthase n=1 Tax=Streptomyces eurocidicus TaxID=66423 RepID=A0A2N8NNY5_STREU|nr:citramalate synthase [Streptomyces eurocidicus]MBB5116775.1 2-isopropylmalate synthase [Streptomyces eurocidicus]MBF6052223.1 citramalate synthase [Streptomyces eurocidicus]PNE30483.1 transferase [Streptomyces eurocidicus]